ncbi:MAG TPA: preprotein translocase subunit SecG [Deltaproteobacteria bacterium]|nr:preprotein translocase subunit SecG [Deltaproteobacteria bacterium]
MHAFISILHIVICLLLIFIVLVQSGKGADMGAAFGGSSQTLFGSAGPATFLGKMTSVIATVFMITSLWLAYFAVHKPSSVIDNFSPPAVEQTIPINEAGGSAPAEPGTVSTPADRDDQK